jgi:hypothetical protein
MKRAGGLLAVAAACTLAACELVAGIQDRVLVAGDASTGGSPSDSSPTMGTQGSEAADDGPGTTTDPADGGGSSMDGSSPSDAQGTAPTDALADSFSTAADVGSPVDAPFDSGSIVDASTTDASFTGTPCSQQINFIFCDDFDSVTDATTNWTWTSLTFDAGGTLQLGQNAPATPPNDLVVVVPAVDNANSIGKVLGTIDQFTLAFDLRIDEDTLDEIPYAIIAQILITGSDGGGSTFNYSLGSAASRAVQIFVNGQQTYIGLPAPPTRQWVHITLGYSAATGAFTTQDGVSLLGDAAAGITVAPGAGTLIVGEVYGSPPASGAVSPMQYSIDDIVIQGSQ